MIISIVVGHFLSGIICVIFMLRTLERVTVGHLFKSVLIVALGYIVPLLIFGAWAYLMSTIIWDNYIKNMLKVVVWKKDNSIGEK